MYENVSSINRVDCNSEKICPIYTGESLNSDGLFGMAPSNRVWKMNYYAALGLKARIALALGTETGYLDARACVDEILKADIFLLPLLLGLILHFPENICWGYLLRKRDYRH